MVITVVGSETLVTRFTENFAYALFLVGPGELLVLFARG